MVSLVGSRRHLRGRQRLNAEPFFETIDGVRFERYARFGSGLSTPFCPRYLTAARRQADLIHFHFPNPLADLALLFGRRSTPLVVTYHADIVRQKAAMRLYAPLMHWLLRRAQRITVATPPQLSFSDALTFHRDRCDIIPFGSRPYPVQTAPGADSRH